MKTTIRAKLFTALVGGVWLLLALAVWLKPQTAYSMSERRDLKAYPALTLSSLFDGSFAENFRTAAADQFPARDSFRTLKALANRYLFGIRDNNGLYAAAGHLSKLEYPQNDSMLQHAEAVFRKVYLQNIADSGASVYLSVVPDKNCFLAAENGYPALDYPAFIQALRGMTDGYMQYIDILPLLSLSDYYATDSHWRQERILPVAEHLAAAMGAELPAQDFRQNTVPSPFYGVWYGQAALPASPDTLHYLTSDLLDSAEVFRCTQPGVWEPMPMYDLNRASGRDPYEMFLGGTQPLLRLDNPNAQTDRELVLFRDSFGSAISPLLLAGYRSVTVVDLRYLKSDVLPNFLSFHENQDVLFLYSTMLLNSSLAIQ